MQKQFRVLWLRWIAANTASELIGLGATFLVIGLVTPRMASKGTAVAALLSFAVAVGSGMIEATVVGLAQWRVLRSVFTAVTFVAWWRATLIGVLFGYVLGYMPSTLMGMSEASGQSPMQEPPQYVVLLLAAGLGAVAGAVLSFFQWRVLRAHVEGAGIWVPANMLAWAFGMPVIFQAMDFAFRMPVLWLSILVVAAGLAMAGAIVGIVHGRALTILARRLRPSDQQEMPLP